MEYAFTKPNYAKYGRHTIYGMSMRVEVSSRLRAMMDIMRLKVLAAAEAFNPTSSHAFEVLFAYIVI